LLVLFNKTKKTGAPPAPLKGGEKNKNIPPPPPGRPPPPPPPKQKLGWGKNTKNKKKTKRPRC